MCRGEVHQPAFSRGNVFYSLKYYQYIISIRILLMLLLSASLYAGIYSMVRHPHLARMLSVITFFSQSLETVVWWQWGVYVGFEKNLEATLCCIRFLAYVCVLLSNSRTHTLERYTLTPQISIFFHSSMQMSPSGIPVENRRDWVHYVARS